jgi:hypothetical protein
MRKFWLGVLVAFAIGSAGAVTFCELSSGA